MELKFFSIDEVKDFVKQLKGTRGGKNEGDDTAQAGATTGNAPAPAMPPPQGAASGFPGTGTAGFAPQGQAAGQPGAGFPAAGVDPAIAGLVQRISARIDGAVASGQSTDAVLQWFRGQCGPEAAGYSLDQIKTVALPKLSLPALENIAKLMAA